MIIEQNSHSLSYKYISKLAQLQKWTQISQTPYSGPLLMI